jgi:hypothetical protein
MKFSRFALPALTLALAFTAVNCGDSSPVAPAPQNTVAVQADLLGTLTNTLTRTVEATGLLRCDVPSTATATKSIGKEGGTIYVGSNVFTVPAGALRERVTITATAPAGKVNVVEFKPDGLRFQKSASLTMSYANCDLLGSLLPKRIAYVSDDLSNIFYYLLSIDDAARKTVTGKVDHFSDYAMSW